MIFWARRKSPDFAEILAELEREQASELSAPSDRMFETRRPPRVEVGGDRHAAEPAAPAETGPGEALPGLRGRKHARGTSAAERVAAAYGQDAAAPNAMAASSGAKARGSVPERPKSESEGIAEELGLARCLTKADLEKLRRDFAKKNHPDRCAPAQRPRAARRMAIANMLIDAALKQRP